MRIRLSQVYNLLPSCINTTPRAGTKWKIEYVYVLMVKTTLPSK